MAAGTYSYTYFRKHFGNNQEPTSIIPLSSIYSNSYENFLQASKDPFNRSSSGLESTFKSLFPIEVRRPDLTKSKKKSQLSSLKDVYYYSHYLMNAPLNSEESCRIKGTSYLGSIYVVTYKISFREDQPVLDFKKNWTEKNPRAFEKDINIFVIKGIPFITKKGSFLINGIDRCIISQLHRSPGIYYQYNLLTHNKELKLIPYYGSSLQLELASSGKIYIKVGNKKRVSIATFLASFGIASSEALFFTHNSFKILNLNYPHISFNLKSIKYGKAIKDLFDARTNKALIKRDEIITESKFKKILNATILNDTLISHEFSSFNTGSSMSVNILKPIEETSHRIKVFNSLKSTATVYDSDLYESLRKQYLDPLYFNFSLMGRNQTNFMLSYDEREHAILTKLDIIKFVNYIINRGKGELEDDNVYHIKNRRVKLSGEILNSILLKAILSIKQKKEYSGREISSNLIPIYISTSLPSNIAARIKCLFYPSILKNYNSPDLDKAYLSNKLYLYSHVNDKFYQSFYLSTKKEIESFLTGSNLSQLLDQLNLLSSITHIRRVSLLGPDGLQRDNVSMETRDVQSSFFGRICPIETPEGKSVGIVNSLTIYSKVSSHGNISSPYRKVLNGKITNQVYYLESNDEISLYIALTTESIDSDGHFSKEFVYCRHMGQYKYVHYSKIDYLDISPRKIVSLSSALIPFVEHNDGNRALMGANMQRQSVVNYVREVPISGSGLERISSLYNPPNNQEISYFTDSRYSIHPVNISVPKALHIYEFPCLDLSDFPMNIKTLVQYDKTNQKSYIHERFSSCEGEQNLVEGSSTLQGEISIGHNLYVGYTSMNGYSFEDSVVISDRIIRDDLFSSFHIKEFVAFDWDSLHTKERITRKVPYIYNHLLDKLDFSGVIRVGARVTAGDIIVGKILIDKKIKSSLSERDKFLQEILVGDSSEKNYVKDTSDRLPIEAQGVIVDVKKFFFTDTKLPDLITKRIKDDMISNYLGYKYKKEMLKHFIYKSLSAIFEPYVRPNTLLHEYKKASHRNIGLLFLFLGDLEELERHSQERKRAAIIQKSIFKFLCLSEINVFSRVIKSGLKDSDKEKVNTLIRFYLSCINSLKVSWIKSQLENSLKLSLGEITSMPTRLVKVLFSQRHIVKSGDKLTGRHGNKGVIAKVVPAFDMPYLNDGTPLDIVLNPIGISSRMNLGQLFEVSLGFVSLYMGKKITQILNRDQRDLSYQDLKAFLLSSYGENSNESSLITKFPSKKLTRLCQELSRSMLISSSSFDGATEKDIQDVFHLTNIKESGHVYLTDAFSGEFFDRKINVGLMYILKLNHLVDEKIHARFTGPYNRVTEQPLGGKSMEGGQRFGEMEVWALQAYGAAYTLFDILTVKSDLKSQTSYPRKSNHSKAYSKGFSEQKTPSDFPEAFNVLLRELWCLGLNIKLNN